MSTFATEIQFDPERHEYRRDGVVYPNVTRILAHAGRCDYSHVEEELRIHSLARGKSVHWMLQLEDESALDYRKVPLRLRGYRKAWLNWKCASGFIPLQIEHKFISHHGFAGTVDRVGSFPPTTTWGSGTTGVVDIKTGEIQDWTRFQLAPYCLAVDERFAIARHIRRVAIQLKADETYTVKEWPSRTWDLDIATFLNDLKEMKA